MRKKLLVGNWKMNLDLQEALQLVKSCMSIYSSSGVQGKELVFAVPFPYLVSVLKEMGSAALVSVAAQNCSEHESGAFTGEVSAQMLKSCGVKYVIIGHSERRQYFHESAPILKNKADLLLKHNLVPIFCCGELLQERESNSHFDLVKRQIQESLFHLSSAQFSSVVIAYEPVWAIGTGKTASSTQAQEMHAFIRKTVENKYGKETASNLSILYGGSCKPDNAKELFSCEDVDGGLIGGASLKSSDFMSIFQSLN